MAVTERPLASRVREWWSLSWARHCGKVIPVSARKRLEGSLPRAHGAAQLGQGAVTAGVFGQDGGHVAEALVTRLRQVELQRGGPGPV